MVSGLFSRRGFLRLGSSAVSATAIGLLVGRSVSSARSTDTADLAGSFADADHSPIYDESTAVFATEPSVQVGEPLVIRARSPHRLDVSIIDVGTQRSVADLRNVDVRSNDTDPARWPILLRSQSTDGWRSGFYMTVARPHDGAGWKRFAPFVVRPAAPPTGIVLQVPFATYQAYNGWGGGSLYTFNSPDGVFKNLPIARPFDVFDGAGFSFYGDWQFCRWLAEERQDVSYVTSFDLHNDPSILSKASLFVSVFHDEYWSTPMRQNLSSFIERGGNAAFLGANSMFWRVRIKDGSMTCRKATTAEADPGPDITAQWRSTLIDQPEDQLLGSRYDSYVMPYGTSFDWTVTNADHWLYDGTGLTNGDRLSGLVGYEWDNAPNPTRQGLTVLSQTAINTDPNKPHRHEATVIEHPGGGTVFNAGTTYWPRFLRGDSHFRRDANVEQITRNLLHRLNQPR